jgi:serine/threonine protein kinase
MAGEKAMLPLTPEQLGRYLLLSQLGQGGMGTVYLAQDTKLDRRVAIKILPAQSVNDPGALARFQREARALAKLSHPGIVQAFDSDSAEGRHFLVMEYVEGKSLADLLKAPSRVGPPRAADYIHQAALALQHAHEKGLVHRDLKPSNLLLTGADEIKILDLGLARFLQDQIGDPSLTREGAGLGTPDYAAPEQFRDAHSADVRSDVYALGCTLYHLLTGQVPFPGSSLAEKLQAHEHKEPAPLAELCPDATAGLSLVVARMMAKKPDDRFQTAQEVADALAPYVPVCSASSWTLRSTATWYRGQLTVGEFHLPRRPRRVLAAVGLPAVLSLAVVAGFLLHHFTAPSPQTGPLSQNNSNQRSPTPGDDPNVLTVSQDAADGGRYRTITQALDNARPGVIIRVLDDKVYAESLALTRASLHEGITLDAPRRASLRQPTVKTLLDVTVRWVTVRGFRFQVEGQTLYGIAAVGPTLGLVLDNLEMQASVGRETTGVTFEYAQLTEDQPAVVQHSRFRGFARAIRVSGLADDLRTPRPARGIALRQNIFADCAGGVVVRGLVNQVQVVGNRFIGARFSALQLINFLDGTGDILIANNTFFECACPLALLHNAGMGVQGTGVQIRNNLFLATDGPDMVYLDTGGTRDKLNGPGNGKLVQARWQFDHNWREGKPPKGNDFRSLGWIPVNKLEVQQERIGVLSRRQGEPGFLRPAKASPLASQGAGRADPALPAYIGAVPPEGAEPWDWTRSWPAGKRGATREQ